MADNDVRIKVSLDGADSVQKGLNGIGDSAGDADSKLGKLGGGLAGAGKALAGLAGVAVAAGGALTAAVVDQYAQYEQLTGGVEKLFGTSADVIKGYAADAYKTAGLTANQYMDQVTSFSAALIQGLGGDTAAASEVANKAIIDMSDNAAVFGSNIGDIQNAYQGFAKQNFTMLDNLKLGYGGTREEMARLLNDSGVLEDGFTATAANLDQVSFDKVIEGIHVVQEQMGIAGTTAKEATETISGSVDMLKASWGNLLVGLGSADADVSSLAGNVIESLQLVLTNVSPVIENIGSNIATLGPKLGELSTTLVGAISSALPAMLQAGVALIGGLASGITSALPTLIPAIIPAVTGLVQMVVQQAPLLLGAGLQAVAALATGIAQALPTLIPLLVNGLVGLVGALIAQLPLLLDAGLQLIMALGQGLIAALPLLISQLPTLIMSIVDFIVSALPQIIDAGIQLFISLITALPEIITTIVAALPQIITSVISAILGAIPLLIDAGIQLLVALVENLPAIISGIISAIPAIISSVISAVIGAIPQLISAGVRLFIALIQNLPTIIATIVGAIPQIIAGIVQGFSSGIGQMATVGLQLIQGLWRGISDAFGWLMGQIGGFANSVIDGIKNFFGIASPSKVMMEIGKFIGQGLAVGIRGSAKDVQKASDDMVKKVLDAFKKGDLSKATARGLIASIKAGTKGIKAAIGEREETIDLLEDARKRLDDLREDRLDTIADIQSTVIGSVDVAKSGTIAGVKEDLEERIKAVRDFRLKLDKLQKMGLDDSTRDSLLDEFLSTGKTGVADALLAGGKTAVKQVADLQKELSGEGKKLGTIVADDMYNAGINAAKGLVQGLESESKRLDIVGKRMADSLVASVKKQLGIHSPSTVFADEVGKMVPAGTGVGIQKHEDLALKPLETLNTKMITQAQQQLRVSPVPMLATPTYAGATKVKADMDTYALSQAFRESMAGMDRGDATPVTLSSESVRSLASAIVDAVRVQTRQGVVNLG